MRAFVPDFRPAARRRLRLGINARPRDIAIIIGIIVRARALRQKGVVVGQRCVSRIQREPGDLN